MNKYISLIGLGAVGAPLADKLYESYQNNFILLSSPEYLNALDGVTINDRPFSPMVVSKKRQLEKKIGIVFVCTKNYQIDGAISTLKELIDNDTIIVPLQNGIYSYNHFLKLFPFNPILEAFAIGPNTLISQKQYSYQRSGSFHIGSSNNKLTQVAKYVIEILNKAGVDSSYEIDIKHQIWKKYMLNVAGNAITALTELDYCSIKQSKEAQTLLLKAMNEFVLVANKEDVLLFECDIKDVMNYYFSFTVSKRTSMLEDVSNKRKTENDFLAGYIIKLADQYGIDIPYIKSLYYLVKIKEDNYLGNFSF